VCQYCKVNDEKQVYERSVSFPFLFVAAVAYRQLHYLLFFQKGQSPSREDNMCSCVGTGLCQVKEYMEREQGTRKKLIPPPPQKNKLLFPCMKSKVV
jgi:hypothetical protein